MKNIITILAVLFYSAAAFSFPVGMMASRVSGLNLICWFTFNEGSGTTALDHSYNSTVGPCTLDALSHFTNGINGSAIGTSAQGTPSVPDHSSLRPLTTPFTVNCWVQYAASTNQFKTVAAKGTVVGTWELGINNSNVYFAARLQGAGWVGTPATATTAFVSSNTWHMVTGSYSAFGFRTYIDGRVAEVQATSGQAINPLVTVTDMSFMGIETKTNTFNSVIIDDFSFYNKELTQSEVTQLYIFRNK